MSVLIIHGQKREYPTGTLFADIAREYQPEYPDDILLVRYQQNLRELFKEVEGDGELEFVTAAEKSGRSTYRRTVTLLMEAAAYNLYSVGDTAEPEGNEDSVAGQEYVRDENNYKTDSAGRRIASSLKTAANNQKVSPQTRVIVQHSIGSGYYCEFRQGKACLSADAAHIRELKEKMQDLVRRNLPILKYSVRTQDAVRYFESCQREDKASLFRYRRNSRVNLYELGGYRDYYYGYMAPSTGYCRAFDLVPYQKGFMLMFPERDTHTAAEFHPMDKLFRTMDDAAAWGESMGVRTIGDLNNVIADGRIQDLVLVQESWMEQKIGDIAVQIAGDLRRKIVLIAGPSSSGKTTFSHRLSIQLTAQGLRPHPISLDDFYVNREDTPLDENGDYDFECLEAIDIALLNRCLGELLEGKAVTLPVFNFRTGHREWRQRPLQISDGDVLVIEGIHGLNDKLTQQLPKESKFKIYISALTHLNIDSQNNLSTTDTRLFRRLVRDARTRNTNARETLARWPSVRRGEEKNIFPFQEEADVMFNTALIYELSVLKCYAEPLLFSVDRGCPEFEEAKRLLKILDYALPVPGESISHNSILREFMGGGCFNI